MTQCHEGTCPANSEISQLKSDIADIRMELREVQTTLQVMQAMMTRPTQRLDMNAEIIVAGGHRSRSAEIFEMTTRTWRPLPEMTEYRDEASSVLYEGHMFVTGGFNDRYEPLDSVEEINLAQQGRWINSQFPLPRPFGGHASMVYQNRLLVMGGRDPIQVYDSIYEIEMTFPHTLRMVTRTPRPVSLTSAQMINDKIYIAGGTTTVYYGDATDTVLMFDPQTNTCSEQPSPLPFPVTSVATATWEDNVVVLGGKNRQGNVLNSVVMYNVTTGRHRILPEMNRRRHGGAAVTIFDGIIVLGGRDENESPLNSVECFNFRTNAWTDFEPMTEARAYPTAVVRYY